MAAKFLELPANPMLSSDWHKAPNQYIIICIDHTCNSLHTFHTEVSTTSDEVFPPF
jgi:hypothetical protein